MSSFDHIRVILSRFITMLLLMSLMLGQFGAVSGVAAQVDVVQGADLDGTPEPIEKPVDAIDDDEPDGIVDSGNSFATAPSTEQVREISLVEPVFLLVDTMADAPLDPCRVIDSRWTSVLVQPFLETAWADPLTGLGGGLWIDIREDSSSFGWDMFAGGVVEGIIVPDQLDDPMAAANFYDYRPFAGAIAGDSGLSSPDGHSSSAYLCVPADEHTDVPSLESTATHIPPVMADEPSTTTPIDHDAISTPDGTVTPRPVPPAPPGSGSASTIYSGSTSSGMIALTYDAGTDRGRAAYILDLLATYGAHATFGMTGTWARDNPDLVQRMVAEGHQLINHTWDHPSFTGGSTTITVLTRSARLDQLDRTENLVQQLTGYQMAPYWRPPYGDINASVLRDVYSGGYYVSVMWSCDTLGWNGLSEQQILNRCMYPSGAGDIILMHLTSDSLDWAATDDMLQYFQSKGLQIVTVEQLLAG